METQQTFQLQLPKWPTEARVAYTVPTITNNLVAVSVVNLPMQDAESSSINMAYTLNTTTRLLEKDRETRAQGY